jgi:hypothetical protein
MFSGPFGSLACPLSVLGGFRQWRWRVPGDPGPLGPVIGDFRDGFGWPRDPEPFGHLSALSRFPVIR